MPQLLENRYPIPHHRALHLQHLFMPETVAGVVGNAEIVSKTGTSDKYCPIVNQYQFAMVAVQIGAPTPEVEWVVEAQINACLTQPLTVLFTQTAATGPVEQAAHPHAPLRRPDENIRYPIQTMSGFHQVKLDINTLLRLLHGLQHARKETVPIHHQLKVIAFTPGIGGGRHGNLREFGSRPAPSDPCRIAVG